MLRYNRVEALSAGVLVESTLGNGYTANALARIGVADWQPNVELHLQRGNGDRTYSLGAYRRLNSANDWGDPLSVGSSISALLWSHDEGFYFRSAGASSRPPHRAPTRSRGACSRSARMMRKSTRISRSGTCSAAPGSSRISARRTPPNSERARSTSFHPGLDPTGLRTTVNLRGEGATGTFDYARAFAEATATHSLGTKLDGALTASVGGSVGSVPVQRLWFLGGVATVRGQEPGRRRAMRTGWAEWRSGAPSRAFGPRSSTISAGPARVPTSRAPRNRSPAPVLAFPRSTDSCDSTWRTGSIRIMRCAQTCTRRRDSSRCEPW